MPASSSTWSSAAVTLSTPSRRASSGRPRGFSGAAEHRQPREVNGDGTFTVVVDGLNRPTSLEFIGNTAYVVTLSGEIWKIDNVWPPHPLGEPRSDRCQAPCCSTRHAAGWLRGTLPVEP